MRIALDHIPEVRTIMDRDALILQGSSGPSLPRQDHFTLQRSLWRLRLLVSDRLEAGMSNVCPSTWLLDHVPDGSVVICLMLQNHDSRAGYGSCARSMYCLVRRSTRWGRGLWRGSSRGTLPSLLHETCRQMHLRTFLRRLLERNLSPIMEMVYLQSMDFPLV